METHFYGLMIPVLNKLEVLILFYDNADEGELCLNAISGNSADLQGIDPIDQFRSAGFFRK